MSITNGNWSRIGDLQLGFGLKRFSTGSPTALTVPLGEMVLWRLQISRGPGAHDVMVDVDATQSDLNAIKRWCDKAIETLQTDGGRIVPPTQPPPSPRSIPRRLDDD